MKKFLISLTCFALIFSVIAFTPKTQKTVFAQEENVETSVIEVIGVGSVNAEPDTAIINVGVETMGENVTDVETENKQKINSIIDVLIENGVDQNKIQTTNYYMYKRYDYQNGQKFLGYQITNSLEFSVGLENDVSQIISNVTNAGVTNVNGIRFVASNKNELYNNALKLALENAKSKANALSLGNSIEIVDVKESLGGCDVEIARYTISNSDLTQIEKGEIIVKASVKVKFKIV